MTQIPVSVIVVSRARPEALRRCLMGIEQLYYAAFELIVVTDVAGREAVQKLGLGHAVKLVGFDGRNISVARNLGLAQAAGEVVAFIDDDAVPEPAWLDHLAAPFADPAVMSATGYVRGRNGISFQSTGTWVDRQACESPEPEAGVFETQPGHALKTVGTNCAFRRDALAEIGGFDPVFRFYLDETDVNMRLAERAHPAAICPSAEVHHGFAASEYRKANRLPRSLFEVGASLAAFLRKHSGAVLGPRLDAERETQRARLSRHLIAGTCEPRDVAPLIQSLDSGFIAGQFRKIAPLEPLGPPQSAFKPFVARQSFGPFKTLTGRPFDRSLMALADAQLKAGFRVSLYRFSRSALFHRVQFVEGAWLQTGGQFGRSDRSDPLLAAWNFEDRIAREMSRVAPARAPKHE